MGKRGDDAGSMSAGPCANRYRDTCQHGVPIRWPEGCIECEQQEVDEPDSING